MGKRIPQALKEKAVRKPIRSRLRTDFSYLEDKYPGKCFRLFNNEMGNVQQAIADGWEPVEGLQQANVWRPDADTPSTQGSYVSIPVGLGRTENAMEAVLLMIDRRRFEELEAPTKEHRAELRKTLEGGKPLDGKTPVPTYAPNLPSGGKGYEEITNT